MAPKKLMAGAVDRPAAAAPDALLQATVAHQFAHQAVICGLICHRSPWPHSAFVLRPHL
jgi:hypothetical protein